jgi:hypothetical protein
MSSTSLSAHICMQDAHVNKFVFHILIYLLVPGKESSAKGLLSWKTTSRLIKDSLIRVDNCLKTSLT